MIGTGCISQEHTATQVRAAPENAVRALQDLKTKYAPEGQIGLFAVGLSGAGGGLALTGIVDNVVAKTETEQAIRALGLQPSNAIRVLPEPDLGERA